MENLFSAEQLLKDLVLSGELESRMKDCLEQGKIKCSTNGKQINAFGKTCAISAHIDDNNDFVVVCKINEIEQVIKDFCGYVENLDDDIFVEACDLYNEKGDLQELDNLLIEAKHKEKIKQEIRYFKECVHQVAYSKIANIINKCGLFQGDGWTIGVSGNDTIYKVVHNLAEEPREGC